jgi:hypothetical protein
VWCARQVVGCTGIVLCVVVLCRRVVLLCLGCESSLC